MKDRHHNLHRCRAHVVRGGRQHSTTAIRTGSNVSDGRRRPFPRIPSWSRGAVAIEGVETEHLDDSDDGVGQLEQAEEVGGWGARPDDDVSFARMIKFILPTLGIWLASPIMSLVDAGVVGELSDAEHNPTKLLYF